MIAFRFLPLLLLLLLSGGYCAFATAQTGDPIRPNERVQQKSATPLPAPKQDKKIEDSALPPLLEKLKPSNWFHKPESKAAVKPKDSRKTEAPLWKPETLPPAQPAVQLPALINELPPQIADAPLPPQDPYFDNIGKKPEVSGVPNFDREAELAEQEIIQHDPFGNEVPDEPPHAGVSSYAFDTRDWVESFPVEHLEVKSEELKAKNEELEVKSENWDGQAVDVVNYQKANITSATPIPVPAEEAPKVASLSNGAAAPSAPSFDLAPSYSKYLPHTAVCGVVVVQANFPLTEIQPILEEILLLQRDLNLYIGVPAAKEKIELCLFGDEKSYQQFLRTVFPNAPRDRRALYIKLDKKPGTLLVQKTEDFEIDLRHEMTHAVIHTSINYVPIWLDEGLAKYFEVPIQDRAADNSYMKQIRWNTKFGAVPPLTRLEKLQDISQMGSKEYRDSWAWVHFLIHYSPQTHRLLAGYLQLLATLSDPQKTAQSKTLKIPPLEAYLEDAVQNPKERYREHFTGTDE
ncbi:MAG: DUF1570 domain-containing protein [Planctomycetaceae bacterium]|nr:DUF1570 domain-containing protein [Planctomycetaceae bacterium]